MMPAGRLDLGVLSPPMELQPLQQVLLLAVPYLGSVYPTSLPDRLDEDHPGTIASRRLAESLGMGKVEVSLAGSAGATAGLGEPVPLVLAPALGSSPGNAAFRFWVGRALCTAATGSVLLEQLRDDELIELTESAKARLFPDARSSSCYRRVEPTSRSPRTLGPGEKQIPQCDPVGLRQSDQGHQGHVDLPTLDPLEVLRVDRGQPGRLLLGELLALADPAQVPTDQLGGHLELLLQVGPASDLRRAMIVGGSLSHGIWVAEQLMSYHNS